MNEGGQGRAAKMQHAGVYQLFFWTLAEILIYIDESLTFDRAGSDTEKFSRASRRVRRTFCCGNTARKNWLIHSSCSLRLRSEIIHLFLRIRDG